MTVCNVCTAVIADRNFYCTVNICTYKDILTAVISNTDNENETKTSKNLNASLHRVSKNMPPNYCFTSSPNIDRL